MNGLTFDTGALIALERRKASMASVFALATQRGLPITVPTVVLAEWYRGKPKRKDDILASVDLESLDAVLAKLAGEAMATVSGSTVVDAIVMASAAQRADIVYTSDLPDLMRLRAFFPNVRVVPA